MTESPIYLQLTKDKQVVLHISTMPFGGGVKYVVAAPKDKPITEPTETPEPIEIPEWAKQRAWDMMNDINDFIPATPHEVCKYTSGFYALALHVLKHETPPVDPLLPEAREIVARNYDSDGCKKESAQVRAGSLDNWLVTLTLDCLRRGIEIGGGK